MCVCESVCVCACVSVCVCVYDGREVGHFKMFRTLFGLVYFCFILMYGPIVSSICVSFGVLQPRPEEVEKLNRRREQNRRAAQKFRKKKREKGKYLTEVRLRLING